MKTIALNERSRDKLLHVELPGCIVNIEIGLCDRDGRQVSRVEVLADGDRYAGDPEWWIDGKSGKGHLGARVVCTGVKRRKRKGVSA
jgi:hypothetical protein